ncbi:MAG: ABC transporter ATP-binding protein [Pseudonocardia sp.]
MVSIEVRDVVKRYGEHVALRGINLSVREGEFLCLLGPSGCGKTTLLRSIAGLETIEGGSITATGELFSEPGYTLPAERRGLGMVFQSYALWPHMTVFRNIAYTLRTNGWDKHAVPDRVREILDLVGLSGMEQRYPGQLSGGQMQRVALARSLAPQPNLLLFDEPLSNLDATLREKMRFELRQIQKRVGITAIYVTHDQAEAMVVADRIALMNAGQVQQLGTARELYDEPTTPFAAEFMGTTNFVPADVEHAASGHARFRWPGGVVVTGRVVDAVAGASRVVTAVRPEHVGVTVERPAQAPESTVLPAIVVAVTYLGAHSDVHVRIGEMPLRATMSSEHATRLSGDDEVWVELPGHRVRGIDAVDAPARAAS